MLSRLRVLIHQGRELTSDSEVKDVAIGLMRITLQYACLALTEWLVHARQTSIIPDAAREPLPLDILRAPADGALTQVLASLLVAAEQEGWNGVSRPFWKSLNADRPARYFVSGRTLTVERVLQGFVQSRNDGVEGHGIPGAVNREALLDAVSLVAEQVAHILPNIEVTSGQLILSVGGAAFPLQLVRLIDGQLLCFRRITATSHGRCTVQAQIQTGLLVRDSITYEAPDILGSSTATIGSEYRIISPQPDWLPFVRIPDRLTLQFTGRANELRELADWADDIDSRACMLYGDGGVGKTTLSIEFIHRLLDGSLNISWRPEVITFYTAKQTRWGLEGMEVSRPHAVGVSDVAVDIVRALSKEPPDREWFDREPEAIISRLATFLQSWGIARSDHLLVLDNTETMISSGDDVQILARQIRELSRRVGRVLLTSRRRESIEARQIEIKSLDSDEAVRLLRARATVLGLQPILQADMSSLAGYCNQLGNKPLVLEVFVQALSAPKVTLKHAFERVMRMQAEDLGEFLYADAWSRLSGLMQHLLLLMTRISDIHDEVLLKLCCQQVGISVMEANEALEESRGIASLTTLDQSLQIAFNPAFLRFCVGRTINIRGIALPNKASVEIIERRYREFLRSQQTKIRTHSRIAYRHPLARAAWLATREERFEDADLFYEEAILKDPDNGFLFDRYAYYLFTRRKYDQALGHARYATQQIPDDAEAWFTRGMIEARLSRAIESVQSLTRAAGRGKPVHMCLIQQAHAYLYDTPPQPNMVRIILNNAETALPSDDPYTARNIEEIARLRKRASEK